MQNSWNKYGIENFEFLIIEDMNNINSIGERESFWIKHYNSNNGYYGYNKTNGGESSFVMNESMKLRISEAAKFREKSISEDKRKKKSYHKNTY